MKTDMAHKPYGVKCILEVPGTPCRAHFLAPFPEVYGFAEALKCFIPLIEKIS